MKLGHRLLILGIVLLAPLTLAQEEPNVLLTFEVGDYVDGQPNVLKTYTMLVEADGKRARMMTGARVPIPTTQFQTSQGTDSTTPVTSFTYQNVGFTAEVFASIDEDGAIALRGHVEDSSLMPTLVEAAQPQIQSMAHALSVSLEDDQPQLIVGVQEVGTRSQFIRVRASKM